MEKPDYGNWMQLKYLYITGVLTIFSLLLSFLYAPIIVLTVLFLGVCIFLSYTRNKLSPSGGDLQSKIQELVLEHLNWDGKGNIIDIGCGNGPLTLKAANKYPDACLTGIDYWGVMWEYSHEICKRNAKIEGVDDRLTFQKASASILPFKDEYFDAAISNLVFHEVKDTMDKRDVIQEALRIVKKGGAFSFQDLFLDKKIYGDIGELLDTIRSWGIENVEFTSTKNSEFIPTALKLPFVIGNIGIIYGTK
jgi:SAM-dependent methyltransferase